jgi:hypothetical protein
VRDTTIYCHPRDKRVILLSKHSYENIIDINTDDIMVSPAVS